MNNKERPQDIKKRIQNSDDGFCNRQKVKFAQEDYSDAVQSLMWDHDMTREQAERFLKED